MLDHRPTGLQVGGQKETTMRTQGAELGTEAAIYSEGTSYTGAYLAAQYQAYADDVEAGGQTPDDFQRWIETAFPSCCE